jgi:hypothetical protein
MARMSICRMRWEYCNKKSSLMIAFEGHMYEEAKLLLEHDADIMLKCKNGHSVLDTALLRNDLNSLSLIKSKIGSIKFSQLQRIYISNLIKPSLEIDLHADDDSCCDSMIDPLGNLIFHKVESSYSNKGGSDLVNANEVPRLCFSPIKLSKKPLIKANTHDNHFPEINAYSENESPLPIIHLPVPELDNEWRLSGVTNKKMMVRSTPSNEEGLTKEIRRLSRTIIDLEKVF